MRSTDWQPIVTAPLNPYGKAYGPAVMIWSKGSDAPVAAYYDSQGSAYDNKPRWVTVEEGAEILLEDATHWMPISAPLPDEDT